MLVTIKSWQFYNHVTYKTIIRLAKVTNSSKVKIIYQLKRTQWVSARLELVLVEEPKQIGRKLFQ